MEVAVLVSAVCALSAVLPGSQLLSISGSTAVKPDVRAFPGLSPLLVFPTERFQHNSPLTVWLLCRRYANTYPLCLSLMASKRVNVKPLITHRFKFTASDVAKGFDTAARADQTGAIKVMFNLE